MLLRLVQAIKPWGMIEVFTLGLLVSLAKLAQVASVRAGIALWAFGGLMLLLAAAAINFDVRAVWARMDRAR